MRTPIFLKQRYTLSQSVKFSSLKSKILVAPCQFTSCNNCFNFIPFDYHPISFSTCTMDKLKNSAIAKKAKNAKERASVGLHKFAVAVEKLKYLRSMFFFSLIFFSFFRYFYFCVNYHTYLYFSFSTTSSRQLWAFR